MFSKISLLVLLVGFVTYSVECYLHEHDEAYVKEVTLPIMEDMSGEFLARYDGLYKIVLYVKKSDELAKIRKRISVGDAYSESEMVGRYLSDGVKIELTELPQSAVNFNKEFSIFGGASGYETTDFEWDSHASYKIGTFSAKMGGSYRIIVGQENVAAAEDKIRTPAYLMVRLVENPLKGSNGMVISIFGLFLIFLTLLYCIAKKAILIVKSAFEKRDIHSG